MNKKRNPYTFKDFPFSSHRIIGDIITNLKSQSILDVGCDAGFVGKSISYVPKNLIGIDKRKIPFQMKYKQIIQVDLDNADFAFLKNQRFDVIVLADIVEHLRRPHVVYRQLRYLLKKKGYYIFSFPNMSFLGVLFFFLPTEYIRMNRGLFDKTHLHIFTKQKALSFLKKEGLKIVAFYPIPVPLPLFSSVFNRDCPLFFVYLILNKITTFFPTFFAYQNIFVAKMIK